MSLQMSGRITYPFFCFFEKHHLDVSSFHELTSIEMSFIKDPSVWMEARHVENFLKQLSVKYNSHFENQKLTTLVGGSCLELEAWGELSHILKLKYSFDVYQKIENILQWFVSPFSIKAVQNKEELISFQCNISSKEYPYSADYLRAMLEVLPSFRSGQTTKVLWEGEGVQIYLFPAEQMSFSLDDEKENISPQLVKELRKSLSLMEKNYLQQKKLLENIRPFQSVYLQKEKIQSVCFQMEEILDQLKNGSNTTEHETQLLIKMDGFMEKIKKILEEENE